MKFKEALERAAALCSGQERNTREMLRKLSEWGVGEEDSEKIIQRLKAERFLDDRRYASSYVKDKFRFNRWGRMKIRFALRQKGIPEDMIEEALDQIDQEEYFQVCRDLLGQKSATLKEKDPYARKARLLRFASQRGFESDLIYRILQSDE
ncbi:MAG TPA: RecX family transcriptional regulator [Bacteroides sp.]|nr:RecX family transcriptional regulator [Bacteroides sp.]